MDLYISISQLIKARKLIQQDVKKPDTFVGIILLLLSSKKVQDYYYHTDMVLFANLANSAFTLKEVKARTSQKSWFALFTPNWANRSLTNFLNDKRIDINTLLSTIFWYKNAIYIKEQKRQLYDLIGEKNFNNLFIDENTKVFDDDQPISLNNYLTATKGENVDGNLTLKYDGSFIVKDAGDLSASPFSQTLYSGLEIKKIVSIFDFNIIGEFKISDKQLTPLSDPNPFSSIKTPILNPQPKPQNLLLYGIAGVGKSYNINKITGEDETYIERIVFHPDYLNTDFIGQILPTINNDGKIEYQFKAGSFTKILKKAINDPSHHYYLVIEEINRGNAPAIFGEVFQLLDRKNEGSSSYRISQDLMAKEIFDDTNTTIFIPNNLSILATMNTADQNVFTLDTAFQRRWTMRMIENNIDNCDYKNIQVLDTGVSWQHFNTIINEHILDINQNTLSSEDKRLGAFFVRADELELPDDLENGISFAEKVIKYLWDDVFKFNKSALFQSHLNSLDKVLGVFKNNQKFSRFDVFKEDITVKLKQRQLSVPQVNDSHNE